MTGMPALAAVVLDLDNTLFDHSASARAGVSAWLAGLGVEMSEPIAQAWFAAEERHHAEWTRGLADFAEHRRRRLREVLPLVGLPVGDDAALDATFADYRACYRGAWRGFDDAPEAVAAIRARGLVVAVLTNGTQDQQVAKLEHLGGGPAVHRRGPGGGQAFTLVCQAIGVQAGRVLHVGDNYDLDVVAARGAGLAAVHLDRAGAGPLGEAERITTLADLPGYLDQLH